MNAIPAHERLGGLPDGLPSTVPLVSERILIVEDEANIASFVAAYLQKAGYQVERAATGAEGIEKAGSVSPALILLDLNLPDIDGLEVCRHDPRARRRRRS